MSTAGGRQVLADLALVTIARHRTLYSIPAESLCLAAHPTEPRTAGVAGVCRTCHELSRHAGLR